LLLRTIAFLVGIITLSFQSQLWPNEFIYLLVLLTPLLLFQKRIITLLFWFCAGFIWATFVAQQYLSHKIPSELEGEDILVTGVISSIPQKIGRRQKFEFTVNSVFFKNNKYNSPQKINLSWYGDAPQLIPDDEWQLLVRLKKPFSYQNPGGFDYEAWMFQNRIDAKGYVRKSHLNKIIQSKSSILSFTRARFFLKKEINLQVQSSYKPIILALLIGDKSEITSEQWQVFRKTGTSHLIAISGLHIGLIAGLVFFLSRWLWAYSRRGVEFIASPKIAAVFAIAAALIYSAMAGFSLPTQRALIMLCVIMFSILFDIRAKSWNTLAIALLLILILSPFAIMNPGFWLSFFAVAIIIYFSNKSSINIQEYNGYIKSTLYNWSLIQVVICIGLTPFVLLFFNESSIVAPIANFVIVPIFSFIIVPAVFVAGCLLFLIPFVSKIIFYLVVTVLNMVWAFLEYLAEFHYSTFQANYLSSLAIVFLMLGILLLFLPKYFPTKILSAIFFLPLFFVKPEKLAFESVQITLLDVGQGLSVVVETHDHVLVYDTGPRFSESFNTGKTVVIPYLQSRGISKIDTMVISHGDNDHIGGVKSIVESITVDKIITSVPKKVKSKLKSQNRSNLISRCNSENQWHWDGIDFKIIHPLPNSTLKGNNASCVLQISTRPKINGKNNQKFSVLLTGDIEAKAENEILELSNINLKSNILIAPHHGSKTSSTQYFIDKIAPDYVLYPVGYRNRYKFPATIVSQRYKKAGVIEYSTSEFGAITFNLTPSYIKKPELYRVTHGRFWHN